MRQLLLLLLFIFVLVVPTSALYANDTFNITLDNTRKMYYIDYGSGNDITLLNYTLNVSANLDAVNDWSVYGANTGEYWTFLNNTTSWAFTANTEYKFDIASTMVARYYGFMVERGFYDVGEILQITFSTCQTGTTPATPVLVSGISNPVIPASGASASGLTYPLIIAIFGGLGVVSVIGVVLFVTMKRRRYDDNDW